MKRTALCMLVAGLAVTGTMAQKPAPVCQVVSLSGTVFLRPNDSPLNKPTSRLSSSRDLLRLLHDGDQLQASRDGRIQIAQSGVLRTLNAKDGLVTLHCAPSILQSAKLTPEEQALSLAIEQFGNPGASREVAPLLWSPAADSSILARDFRLRWNPPQSEENFSIAILRQDGSQLWFAASVDSANGSLTPKQEAEVAQLLVEERSPSELQSYFVAISSDLQGSPKFSFSVLSAAEEAQLQAELAGWDKAALNPLMRALCRAEAWRHANLIYKAAEEFDQALLLAPSSEALIEADLAAHHQIGDLARSRELAVRLHNLPSE